MTRSVWVEWEPILSDCAAESRSRFPEGMTDRKARATTGTECGSDGWFVKES